jgi:DNA repair exonuclease SbcCD ATPase subunit
MRAFLSDFTLPDNEFFKVFGQPPKRSNYIEWRDDNNGDALDNDQQILVSRYYEYNVMCRIGGEKPMSYEDWLEFDKRYQEHVRTAPSPLAPHTFQKIDEVNQEKPTVAELQKQIENLKLERDKIVKQFQSTDALSNKANVELRAELDEMASDRNSLREANQKLALRCQELVDSYEKQKAELWSKIECLRDRVNELTSAPDDLGYTYEELASIRTELIAENEEILKELETLKSGIGQRTTPANQPLYPHYFRDVSQLTHVDVYWVLQAWSVNNPSVQHAVKKLLAAGQRGAKDEVQDLKEARNSINRAIELEETK